MINNTLTIKLKHLQWVMLFVLTFIFNNATFAQNDFKTKLQSLGIAQIKPITALGHCKEAYTLFIEQPLDHTNPARGTFKQKVYISHIDFSKPVVLITEGYEAPFNYVSELADILKCNQIVVEHRYFGQSKPDSMLWQYLTVAQAAADHHAIVQMFKKLYSAKWINTGISKGGQTTIFHRYFYPNDVDVSVPYVAPLNFLKEDPRIYDFLEQVGDAGCRKKIIDYQQLMLRKRDELFPLFMKESTGRGYTFSIVGNEATYEYSILEYSFAFWQWGASCSDIPTSNAPNDELINHFFSVSDPSYFSDKDILNIQPFFYQALTEIGYYGYDITPFRELLKTVKQPSYDFSLPKNVSVHFDPQLMHDIYLWLQDNGNNFIYIYGGNDTWSATAVRLTGRTNAVKMVKSGGCHTTRIKDFIGDDKKKIYSALEQWLGINI